MSDTPKPMEGTWTLTAPDGRTWQAQSPLRVVAMESRERIPAAIRLKRILDAADEPTEREKTLALLVKRLCRRLQPDDNLREGAADYLRREGLLGSPLRADVSGVSASLPHPLPTPPADTRPEQEKKHLSAGEGGNDGR